MKESSIPGHLVFCRLLPLSIKKPLHNEARPRERSDRGRSLPLGKKASSYRGAYRVSLFHKNHINKNIE